MSSEEWTAGNGRRLTFDQAARELENHGVEWRRTPNLDSRIEAKAVFFAAGDTAASFQWEALPLNSKAILEWLGY